MTTDVLAAVATVLRRALTDDQMLEVARTLLSEMGELDLLTPADLHQSKTDAQETMLERAFVNGDVIWAGDLLTESKTETFWLPTPQIGARVEVTIHLTNGTHTITGELVGKSRLGVVVRDEKTGSLHHLPGLCANNVRVLN